MKLVLFEKKKMESIIFNLKKILTEENKELSSVHSGNVNKIKLPAKLPYLTMFRIENNEEEMCISE